uniref:Aspartate-semialdehyde dehydrogenase n=1 Tax=Arcella intermedia TaxID=1963864 RepID=A0A6B2L865_9EUKA
MRVGILGCTGSVGQRFVQLLENHPWFQITTIGASERSTGKTYGEVVHWVLPTPIPDSIRSLPIVPCEPQHFPVDLVFSGLDASVAGTVEENFAKADIPVFSNAKNHRYDPDVPILIPAVNEDHIDVIPRQRKFRGWKKGFIITNANCSSTGLVVVLKPLQEAFGLKKVHVVTLQAISGAGYPGVSAYDIYGNVIPFISGEEEKLQIEPLKILGNLKPEADGPNSNTEYESLDFKVSAQCTRVPVIDGHTECVSLEFEKKPTLEEIKGVLGNYTAAYQKYDLPSKPPKDLLLLEANDRPQPRLDLSNGNIVSVGRVRPCPLFDYKLVLLSHNTVIGAAGGSILNAELAKVKGYL